MQYTSVAFPCMRVGHWDSGHRPDWSEHDLQQLCRNFRRKEFTSVLKLGHDCIPLAEMPDDAQPAVGRISRIWVEGTGRDAIMWAEADRVPAALAEAIRRGHYTSASIEVRDLPLAAPVDERTQLLGVALLGAAAAACDLPDLAEVGRMSAGSTNATGDGHGPAMPPATTAEREPVELRAMRVRLSELHAHVDSLTASTKQMLLASEPNDLDTLKARLGEMQQEVAKLEGQRAARAHDGAVDVPGVGAQLAHGSSMADERDGHVHPVSYDPHTGSGAAGTAGEPPHEHEVRDFQLVPTDIGGGVRSSHPGPLTAASPTDTSPRTPSKTPKHAPLNGTFPPGVRVPLGESYDERSRRLVREATDTGVMPLYRPADRVLASELGDDVEAGERARFDQLSAVADRYKLDLTTRKGMDNAKRIMFRELANTVASAQSFDEALYALERDSSLTFAQAPRGRVVAARIIARCRPDLCDDYGRTARMAQRVDASEGEWSQVPAYEHRSMPAGDERLDPEASDDQRIAAFARLVRAECERLGLLAGVDDEAIHGLKRRLLKAHPWLAPRYRSRPPVEVKD